VELNMKDKVYLICYQGVVEEENNKIMDQEEDLMPHII